MTAHRKMLRDAARAALAAALPGWRLPRSLAHALDTEALPVAIVTVPGETSGGGAQDMLRRDVSVSVILRIEGGDEIEDVLDGHAALVESAVGPALDGTPVAMVTELAETRIQLAGDGARRIGQVELRWTCIVNTNLPG